MPDTLVMCAGPRCGSGQIHEGDDVMMICNACGFKTCARHKLPWHEGQTCIEYDDDESQIERMEQEEATAKRIAKSSQICPKCGNGVERSEGCDHMTCKFVPTDDIPAYLTYPTPKVDAEMNGATNASPRTRTSSDSAKPPTRDPVPTIPNHSVVLATKT